MITLYIKTHIVTGLKYFGMTTQDDPLAYWGSGIRWRRHLMKHGYDFDTEIYLQSEDQEYITREALRFSRAYDIVKSDLWANLIEENGSDGWPKGNPNLKLKGVPLCEERKQRISKAHEGKVIPNKTRKKMADANGERCREMAKAQRGISLSKEHCEKLSKVKKGVPFSKEHRENLGKVNKSRALTWLIIDPSGNEQIVVNLNTFCEENNLSQAHMNGVASGKRKHHKGYLVKRMENSNEN